MLISSLASASSYLDPAHPYLGVPRSSSGCYLCGCVPLELQAVVCGRAC